MDVPNNRQVELLARAQAEAEAAKEAIYHFELKVADLEKRSYLQAYELAQMRAQRDAYHVRAIDLEIGIAHLREKLATLTAQAKPRVTGHQGKKAIAVGANGLEESCLNPRRESAAIRSEAKGKEQPPANYGTA
jgi:hypothetical protein